MNIAFLVRSAFALFGLYMFRHALTHYRSAVASQQWPSVQGRLTDITLWGKRNINGEMQDADKLAVKYNYELNGVKYAGASVAFHTLMYPETLMFAKSRSANSDINIFYNPKEPAQSVLIPGLNKDKPYSDLILAISGVAMGIVIAILGWMGIIG